MKDKMLPFKNVIAKDIIQAVVKTLDIKYSPMESE